MRDVSVPSDKRVFVKGTGRAASYQIAEKKHSSGIVSPVSPEPWIPAIELTDASFFRSNQVSEMREGRLPIPGVPDNKLPVPTLTIVRAPSNQGLRVPMEAISAGK
jgi:hypothetical protein